MRDVLPVSSLALFLDVVFITVSVAFPLFNPLTTRRQGIDRIDVLLFRECVEGSHEILYRGHIPANTVFDQRLKGFSKRVRGIFPLTDFCAS